MHRTDARLLHLLSTAGTMGNVAFDLSGNPSTMSPSHAARNIVATRTSYDLNHVTVKSFNAATNVTAPTVAQSEATLNNIQAVAVRDGAEQETVAR